MDKRYTCYCGLYCENCAVKVKVEPAARILHNEMTAAGFEDVISFIPGGEGFWSFLKGMAGVGICISCRDGGGDPACAIRICAKEKGVEMCAMCGEYPCGKLADMFKRLPLLERDNELLRVKGWEAWAALQDGRRTQGYTLNEFLSVQSRCGLLCDGCSYRQSHHCTGCIALNGKPFWGECPVAKCCQDKGYIHCGKCPDIPCEKLRDFSCGDDEHSDKPKGARIAVCRAWTANEI